MPGLEMLLMDPKFAEAVWALSKIHQLAWIWGHFCRAHLCGIRAEGIKPSNLRGNQRQEWELGFALFAAEQSSSSCVFSPDLLIPVMLPHKSLWCPLAGAGHTWVFGSHGWGLQGHQYVQTKFLICKEEHFSQQKAAEVSRECGAMGGSERCANFQAGFFL